MSDVPIPSREDGRQAFNEALAQYVKQLKEGSKTEIKRDETFLKEPEKKDGGAPGPADQDEEEY